MIWFPYTWASRLFLMQNSLYIQDELPDDRISLWDSIKFFLFLYDGDDASDDEIYSIQTSERCIGLFLLLTVENLSGTTELISSFFLCLIFYP